MAYSKICIKTLQLFQNLMLTNNSTFTFTQLSFVARDYFH